MSSRALRRAQKELEEKKRLEQLAQSDEESEEEAAPVSKGKPSLFAMLGDTDGGDDDGFDNDDEPTSERDEESEPVTAPPPKSAKRNKKKKQKKKGKAKTTDTTPAKGGSVDDEIDRALEALRLSNSSDGDQSARGDSAVSEELQHLFAALAVDTQYLQPANEMRKLFGRAALQADEGEAAGGGRRGRGQQGGLAAAVAGRNAPGARNLASLGLRRNIFVQGKEDWPRATLGGLGMEVVEKRPDGVTEYRFVHNSTYQSVQRGFETCVASMDPERMIQHLHYNPYHISTLLQVSEIAKQQRDVATSGDLLERALFSFGRAVHSTFANSLSQGKARLDFRRPENREFWLAVWRYISSLGVRATWRTAFEWAKLLLSMDPEGDPYCIRLIIDQLALRGRQAQGLLDLVESDYLQRLWKIPPNLAMSTALAHDHLKNPEKARTALRLAIQQYPWITSRLCKELEISPIPKSVWGKEPNNDYQELLCQLYMIKTKDLWNTPEATTLLMEVAHSVEDLGSGNDPYWLDRIDELKIGRHIILSDERALLSLLDPRVKAKYTSTSDPLPPADSIGSYTTVSDANQEVRQFSEEQLYTDLERLRAYFSGIDLDGGMLIEGITRETLESLLQASGTTLQEFRRNSERVEALRNRMHELNLPLEQDTESGSEG